MGGADSRWWVVFATIDEFDLRIGSYYMVTKYKKTFLIKLIKEKTGDFRVSWKTEIWPLQWRIALSWLSGYFIFQLFTPILFITTEQQRLEKWA